MNKNKEKNASNFSPKSVVHIETFARFLNEECGITDLQQFTSPEMFSYNMNSIFLGRDKDGIVRFIKTCRKTDVCENEYMRSMELWQQSPNHFVRPIAYRIGKPYSFIISEYMPCDDLAKVLKNGELEQEQKKNFLEDIYEIYKALHRARIVHRDICPKNLLVYNNHLVLIDCQLSVRADNYKEVSLLPSIERVCRYNRHHSLDEMLMWDDTDKLVLMLQTIGPADDYTERYQAILNEISSNRGSLVINYPVPPAEELLQRIQGCKIKSTFNLRSSKRKKYRKLAKIYKYILKKEYNIEEG